MPLPDLIEIVPLAKPVHAQITVPGSKSITNRALVLAALAEGETTLLGALWSEDTQVMVECLQELGFMVNVRPDPEEACNRTITVYGKGGGVPRGGTAEQPLELFVGNAGTAARFLAALVCLGQGVYRLDGVPRMRERPQQALFQALRELGYQLESANDKLPALIQGGGPQPGQCRVSIQESSQFASALLLCAATGKWEVRVTGENAEESPYVAMTSRILEVFPRSGGRFQIEPDASSGSYFVAAADYEATPMSVRGEPGSPGRILSAGELRPTVTVRNWPQSGWQIDSRFLTFAALHAVNRARGSVPPGPNDTDHIHLGGRFAGPGPVTISRATDLGDSIMTAITLAPLLAFPVLFTDLGRLRVQECERVIALRTELTRCGAKVLEQGDTLVVSPSQLHGAEIETYNDHRMAMCFAILGLKIPGIRLKHPSCVKKTFPNFFQKLAAAPPRGLGARVLDGRTGRELALSDLFADESHRGNL